MAVGFRFLEAVAAVAAVAGFGVGEASAGAVGSVVLRAGAAGAESRDAL